ncbi:MAG: MucR family transcriptional regulator [Alphaproteobacteria bacterium]|nr:MucR family transcriptional regulator [Alphaproteobacteria bacterium]
MAEHNSAVEVDLREVAHIVSSYVRHHQITAAQLAGLIVEVHRALVDLGRVEEPSQPAVPIPSSAQPDYVVCLECGFHAQMLRRHLRIAHGLDAAAYRTRWRLPVDYPLTAPVYSARRSTLAKELGLGRRAASKPGPSATEQQVIQRRGRRPRRSPAT